MDIDTENDYTELTLPQMEDHGQPENNSDISTSPPAALEMDDEATLFYGLTYLGAASINAPRSVMELQRNISVLNNEMDSRIIVILSIPTNFRGTVRIYEQEAQSEIRAYGVQSILFCVRGRPEGPDGCCFAFTVSHGDTPESVTFLSHVFKAETIEIASKVLSCFGACFQSRQQSNSLTQPPSDIGVHISDQNIVFEMNADIKEDDTRGGYTSVPKDRNNVVKLRKGLEKMVVVTLKQMQGPLLKMERCFGVLLCAGWRQKDSDMNLLDMTSMGNNVDSVSSQNGQGQQQPNYSVSAIWNPNETVFELLNSETTQGFDRYLTIAIDMVLIGVAEPVRFCIDMRAKIYGTNERFWQFTRRCISETFYLKVEPVAPDSGSNQQQASQKYRLVKCERQSDIEKDSNSQGSEEEIEEHSDDEIVLSGMGDVSKEVNDEALMMSWRNVMASWKVENYTQRPRSLVPLVRKRGVPEALRGEVWQLLAGAHEIDELLEKYRRLVVEECHDYDAAIIRDINRTFPGNNFFRSDSASSQDDTTKGAGQESLLRVCRAYALIDREIGYCQGISFLAAALLLHMPEEQAFCVLFKMMSSFGLRELYLPGFEKLHITLYQLDVYLRRQLPDLADHFRQLGIESHMYASQWFLTLFVAKFPLQLVFHILDVFFLDGFVTLFAVAISLLTISRTELLKLDFEGVLKYFRIYLPKRFFRSEQFCSQLMATVASKHPSAKLLAKWEADYKQMKLDQMSKVDLTEMLRNENRTLMERLSRLESENDALAQEMINSKLNLRNELEKSNDTCEALKGELESVKILMKESLEDKWRLESDLFNLKEVCRKETERLDKESSQNSTIISEYKEINKRLGDQLEALQVKIEEDHSRISQAVAQCDRCHPEVTGILSKKVGSNGDEALHRRRTKSAPGESDSSEQIEAESIVHLLEVELASTKLALVEAQCEIQELKHDKARQNYVNSTASADKNAKFGFLQKTISLVKDVTSQVAAPPGPASSGTSAVSTPSNSMSSIAPSTQSKQ